jgi:uncharacterized membrane protein YedE/YeeE
MKQTPGFMFTAFLAGLLFAIGLGVSGMVQPAKVIGFLDISSLERWNPALMWVMVGAIGTFAAIQFFASRLPKPLFAANWSHIPARGHDLDTKASIGNLLFGIGWGLAGYCPGPAIVSLASGSGEPLIFVTAMFTGFFAYEKMTGPNKKQMQPLQAK